MWPVIAVLLLVALLCLLGGLIGDAYQDWKAHRDWHRPP